MRVFILLGRIEEKQNRPEKAEEYYKQSIKWSEPNEGMESKVTTDAMINLAQYYDLIGEFEKSEILFKQLLPLDEAIFKKDMELAKTGKHYLSEQDCKSLFGGRLGAYARHLKKMGNVEESEKVLARSKELRRKD